MAETELLWVSVSFGMAFSSTDRQCSNPRSKRISPFGRKTTSAAKATRV